MEKGYMEMDSRLRPLMDARNYFCKSFVHLHPTSIQADKQDKQDTETRNLVYFQVKHFQNIGGINHGRL